MTSSLPRSIANFSASPVDPSMTFVANSILSCALFLVGGRKFGGGDDFSHSASMSSLQHSGHIPICSECQRGRRMRDEILALEIADDVCTTKNKGNCVPSQPLSCLI